MAKSTKTAKTAKAAKPAAKSTKTATAKKAPAKKATPSRNGDLRKPQVRVLEVLAKSRRPMTRSEISEKGKVDLAMLNSYIGSHDEDIRRKNDEKVCVSLLTRKFVKYGMPGENSRGSCYEITKAGEKALKTATS